MSILGEPMWQECPDCGDVVQSRNPQVHLHDGRWVRFTEVPMPARAEAQAAALRREWAKSADPHKRQAAA